MDNTKNWFTNSESPKTSCYREIDSDQLDSEQLYFIQNSICHDLLKRFKDESGTKVCEFSTGSRQALSSEPFAE